jgi:SAM-dependent methyltransferase
VKELVRKHLPRSAWRALALVKYWALDLVDALLRRRDPMVPPRRLVFTGGGDFNEVGNAFLGHFRELCQLRPDENVLDVGSGIGRMAVPLTSYLSSRGSYDGIDIVPTGVRWCTKTITPRHPNFRFHLADVRNQEYNPRGGVTAADYRFPFADASFDFVFMTSVFTHMLPREVENYLDEVHRVLRPGGRSFITWFLLNEESKRLIDEGRSSFDLRFSVDGCRTINKSVPEEMIAYEEERVLDFYSRRGFVDTKIAYGEWCGRSAFLSFQDICVAGKAVSSVDAF